MNISAHPLHSFIEPLEARIAPAFADLVLQFVSIKFPDVAVPGDEGSMTIKITNIGDAPATHPTCINFWLVPDPGAGVAPGDSVYLANGFNTSKSEKIVDGLKDVALNLAHGETKEITKKFTLPDMVLGGFLVAPTDFHSGGGGVEPFNMTPGPHFIVAEVDGASENDPPIWFLYHQNNFAASPSAFDYQYKLGNVSPANGVVGQPRTGVSLNAVDADGTHVVFDLKGPGSGAFTLPNSFSDPAITDLALKGTSAASIVSFTVPKSKTGDGRITLNNLSADAALKGIKFPQANVTGNVAIAGALEDLVLGDIGGVGKSVTLGAGITDKPVDITFGHVSDLDLTVAGKIGKLDVADWTNPNADPDLITAPSIHQLTSDGDFAASFTGGNVDSATIAGALRGGTWNTATIEKLTAGEIASNWKLENSTAVKALTVKGPVAGQLNSLFFNQLEFEDFSGTINAYGNFGRIMSLKAAKVSNPTITATGLVKLITVEQWTGGSITAQDYGGIVVTGKGKDVKGDLKDVFILQASLSAAGIGIIVKGIMANVTINGTGMDIREISADEWSGGTVLAGSLRTLKLIGNKADGVNGDLNGVNISLTKPASGAGTVQVAGFINNSTINAAGSIGTVQALGMTDSTISASGAEGIAKLWIKGKETGGVFFAASQVSATKIATVIIGNVDESGAGADFGITAGAIAKYTRNKNGHPVKRLALMDDPTSSLDTVGKYQLKIT